MKNKTTPIYGAGYCRRSTKTKQEMSIFNQKLVIEKWAKENNCRIIKYFIDDGVSGTDTRSRKAFLDMISEGTSKDCPFSVVVTLDCSRWSRASPDEAGHFEWVLLQNGIKVQYVAEGLTNDGSVSDHVHKAIKRILATAFSKDQAKKTIRGSITYTKLGYSVGGSSPYGYDRLLVDKNNKPIRVLKPGQRKSEKTEHIRYVLGDHKKVRTVKKIFDMIANKNLGLRKVCNTLNRQKIPSPTGKLWNFSSLRSILKNPRYTGEQLWNRSNRSYTFAWWVDAIDVKIGERKTKITNRWKEPEQWIQCENAHEPIISKKVFQKTQRALAKRKEHYSGLKKHK